MSQNLCSNTNTATCLMRTARRAALLVGLCLWGSLRPALAASVPSSADLLTGDFYRIELVVFMSLNTSEANTAETLTATDRWRQPANLGAFRSFGGNNNYPFELESQTQRMLRDSRLRLGDTILPYAPLLPEPGTLVAEVPAELAIQVAAEANSGLIDRSQSNANAIQAQQPAQPDPNLVLQTEIEAYQTQLLDSSFQFATGQLTELSEPAARLNRSRGFRLLLSGTWHQSVPARSKRQPLLIQTGTRTGDLFQLEGSVSVALGRYLHFGAKLWYYEPELGAYSRRLSTPAQSNSAAVSLNADTRPEDVAAAALDANASAVEPGLAYELILPPGNHFMHLAERRRMRSAEVHYLDHPKLGVLVRIDPVPLSDAIVKAYEAVQSSK